MLRARPAADRAAVSSAAAFTGTFLVDGRVHWYEGFGPGLLDRAADNLAEVALLEAYMAILGQGAHALAPAGGGTLAHG